MTNPEPPNPNQAQTPGRDEEHARRSVTARQTHYDKPSALRRYAVPAALVLGGVTVGSFLAPIGFASAQDDADDQADQNSETDDSTVSDGEDADRGRGHGRRGPHGHAGRGPELDVLTDILDMDADELRAAFAEGRSLADIAAEQGVAVEDLTAALVAEAEQRIDDAVAAGRLDTERAEDMKVDLAERIEDRVNRTPGERDGFGPGRGHRGPGGMFGGRAEMGAELSEFLGLTTDELRAAFDDGQSLAEVAAEQGVSEDELVDFLLGRLEERLDQAVEDNRIDADRAEQMLENAEERIQDHIDDVPGERRHDGHHGLRGHGGSKGFGGDGTTDSPSDSGVTNDTSFEA